jgi:hypothetical protein
MGKMTTELELKKIRLDGGTQARSGLDNEHVQSLVLAYRQGDNVPKPVVFWDSKHFWLADGFHRVEARRTAEFDTIDCEVHNGTLRDAVLHAVGANARHGLKRSLEDRRQAVRLLLGDKEWREKVDSWVAEQANVSTDLVARVREDMEKAGSPAPKELKAKDGRTFKNRTAHKRGKKPGRQGTHNFERAHAALGVFNQAVHGIVHDNPEKNSLEFRSAKSLIRELEVKLKDWEKRIVKEKKEAAKT